MKLIKLMGVVVVLVAVGLLPACLKSTAQPATMATRVPPAEIVEQKYLFEVVRYLYRWQLDESEVERIVGEKTFVFQVRRLDIPLDAGDRSVLAEIVLPQLGMAVRVKKADYMIEELGLVVKNPSFKIQEVTRGVAVKGSPGGRVVEVDMKEMRDYLFRTRNQQDFPDAQLIEHLRLAVRKEAGKLGVALPAAGEQIVHLAPLSPVANETWVYWENGHKLLYFSSDIDLANPAVWEHETLLVRVFDLDDQVVVSHQEAGSSNRYLTRYQVSRALFNCMVLGQRMAMTPPAGAAGSATRP